MTSEWVDAMVTVDGIVQAGEWAAYCNECAAFRPAAMGEDAQMICEVCGCADFTLPACGQFGCPGCGRICL